MRTYILLLIGFAGCLAGHAQTTVISVGGTSSLTIKSGTIFSADSLVLTPGTDLTLSSNNIQVSPTAVTVAPAPGINRVYTLGSQVSFTGTIQLYYQPSELNGNPEASLQYTDSAVGGTWVAEASSTVNTTSHFVQYAATAQSFIGATASHQGTVLAISLVSFTGAWEGNNVGLQWAIDQSREAADFVVDRSTDGVSWTRIGNVSGRDGDGLFTYGFADIAPPAGALLYRLEIVRSSGKVSYSNIVRLRKDQDSHIRLLVKNHGATIYFDGAQPSIVRLVNAAGQTVRMDKTSRPRYDFDGLLTGVYFLQYEINGQPGVKRLLIP